MTIGITETQENLLDMVARPSKRIFLRRMLANANESDNDKEIRRIEKLLQGACDDIKEVKAKTGLIENVGHMFASMIKGAHQDAEKAYPSKRK
jgi:hypothetical protein